MRKFIRFSLIFLLPMIVLVIGTIGFMKLEGISFVDALYLTIVTVTTVGYGDITPTTTASKIFCAVLIIIGIGAFFTIISNAGQILLQRSQNRLRIRRLNMIIGVFFTEVGNELINIFNQCDPNVFEIRKECQLEQDCSETDFITLRNKLKHYKYSIAPKLMDLERLTQFLIVKEDILFRQLENPSLSEHESFTDLLWLVIHLRDELLSRRNLQHLSDEDTAHIENDVSRVYISLVQQWVNYMHHLKKNYPYLFSLAIRTNPFGMTTTAEIE